MAETPQAPRRWYVVRTFSGHENKVKLHLEKESKELKLEDRIFAVMVPSEKIIEMKDKKKKSRTKTFFPGYILVEAILDKVSKHLILNAPSVMGFVGTRGEPVPLQTDEVRRLIGRIESRKDSESITIPFNIGEPVKVVDGPFNNFTGVVQEVNEEKMKLKVMVSIFGRKTPVELDFSQVEAEK
ncbi:MAG TPA: transcription termination/antitermination protein NusG [Bacteroidota bacterium]|nr:transcription termination/antitermination protein NusG [Bacteroidota bacterium]